MAHCGVNAGEAHLVYTISPRRDSVPGGHASPECMLACHVQVKFGRARGGINRFCLCENTHLVVELYPLPPSGEASMRRNLLV